MSSCHRGASALPIVFALALASCGTDGASGAGEGPLRDAGAMAGQVPSRSLAAEPLFSLAESTGHPEFFFVDPLGGIILEDGSTIIRDSGRRTLVYLDSVGSPTRIAGARGEGPGEFQSLSEILAAPGESGVWAWDVRSGRLSHFDRSGEHVTSFIPPPGTGAPPVAILPGPTFVTISEPREGPEADARRLYALRDSQRTVVGEIQGPAEPVSAELVYEAPAGIANHTRCTRAAWGGSRRS